LPIALGVELWPELSRYAKHLFRQSATNHPHLSRALYHWSMADSDPRACPLRRPRRSAVWRARGRLLIEVVPNLDQVPKAHRRSWAGLSPFPISRIAITRVLHRRAIILDRPIQMSATKKSRLECRSGASLRVRSRDAAQSAPARIVQSAFPPYHHSSHLATNSALLPSF
jgi:hypothetical protein